MSKLTFSSLPDVCLLLVFDKIALDDLLLNVNLVNRHWNTISAVASQHRKRLVISLLHNADEAAYGSIITSVFTNPFEVSRSNWHYLGGAHQSLIVPEARLRLNRESIEYLVERLTNISTLEVELNRLDISTSEHLATLINGWREHLVTLKLFTNYSGDRKQSLLDGLAQLTNLHTTINSLPVLHYLTYQLNFPFRNQNRHQIGHFTFPISCPSLKELYFTSPDLKLFQFYNMRTIELFDNPFRNYVQSKEASELKKIAFYDPNFDKVNDHLAKSDVFSSKTTHISLNPCFNTETNLIEFSRKFYNLSYITCNIHLPFSIDILTKGLSILENLKHITFCYIGNKYDDEIEENGLQNNNSARDKVLPQMDKIIPLTRIKSVYIDLQDLGWHQFMAEDLCFHLVFPSVELISIQNYNYACIHCGEYFDPEMCETTRKFEWPNCIKKFLAPIAKCDKLKRIEYTDGFDLDFCCSLDCFKFQLADFID